MDDMMRRGELEQATSAVVVSLLKTLVDKEILSNTDVRALLSRAASDLGPFEHVAPARGAAGIILNDLLPRFAEDGGD